MAPPSGLRFCMVTTFYPPYHFGGDGVYVYRLSEALAERGHTVDVVHSVDAYHLQHPAEPEVSFSHHPNVTRHALESKRPTLAALAAHQFGRPAMYARRLREILEDNHYDVIHFHNVSLMGAPGVLRLGKALKLYTTHEYWLICPTHVLFKFDREACTQRQCLACTLHSKRPPQAWRYTGLLHRCLESVDCLLVPSRFALEQHRAAGINRPMHQLPPFVPAPCDARGVSEIELPHGPFFLYVGRLEKLKGVQDLVRLFESYRHADLLIVGEGSYGPILREQARDLRHVKFMGRLHPTALGELYRRATAVLVPSLCYETFGLTAAESLAYGTPAIVRRIGALTEIVEESGGGYTFGSLDECQQIMERLRTEPGLRETLGRRGQLTAARSWSPETHLDRYLRLVDSLIESKSGESATTALRLAEPPLLEPAAAETHGK